MQREPFDTSFGTLVYTNRPSNRTYADEHANKTPTADTVGQWVPYGNKVNDRINSATATRQGVNSGPMYVNNPPSTLRTPVTYARPIDTNIYIKHNGVFPLSDGDIVQSSETKCYYSIEIKRPDSLGRPVLTMSTWNLNGYLTTCGGWTGTKFFRHTPDNSDNSDSLYYDNLEGKFFIPQRYIGNNLQAWRLTQGWNTLQRTLGGKPRAKPMAASKPNGPPPSAERVTVKGRNRIVYVGSKGGRYIKSKGEFVRL